MATIDSRLFPTYPGHASYTRPAFSQAFGFRNFRDFRNLCYLDVDCDVLLGHNISVRVRLAALLPASLEHLRLHEYVGFFTPYRITELTSMVELKSQYLPKLQRIEMHLQDDDENRRLDKGNSMTEFSRTCQANDVVPLVMWNARPDWEERP